MALVNMKMKNFDCVQKYANELIIVAMKANNAGLKIDDELTTSLMLAGLPEEYKALVMAVENSKEKLTVDSPRTKQIDIKAKLIRQKIEDKEVILKYVSTKEMLADMFTKAVTPQKLNYFCNMLGLK